MTCVRTLAAGLRSDLGLIICLSRTPILIWPALLAAINDNFFLNNVVYSYNNYVPGAGSLASYCPLHSRHHWDCEKVFHYPLPTSPFISTESQILATLQQGSHVGWKQNTIFLCTACIRIKSLVHIGEKHFCSCQPMWPPSLHLQTSNSRKH